MKLLRWGIRHLNQQMHSPVYIRLMWIYSLVIGILLSWAGAVFSNDFFLFAGVFFLGISVCTLPLLLIISEKMASARMAQENEKQSPRQASTRHSTRS